MINTPDRWVVLKLDKENETYYKILAGWSGGYLDGDSWKLNSGITKVEDWGDHYLVHGYSSSVYKCYKGRKGYTMLMGSIFSQLQEHYGEDVMSESSIDEAILGL